MIFLVKDDSTVGMDKVYKVHFYSYRPVCDNFFAGKKPTNLYRDPQTLKLLKTYVKLMSKFNVYFDVIIRRKYS